MSILELARTGFSNIDLPEPLKEKALGELKLWLEDPRFKGYRASIEGMVKRGQFELLVDSFYRMIAFGTGGRRGWVGVGPNRINPYTVTTSVQGHCQFLDRRTPGGPWTVVLAWDVRRFEDSRNLYDKENLPILNGLTSLDLAQMAAEVYAANGVKVVMLDPAEESFVSTPELSFHIYRLGAQGGLNVSASHNPPDDNGAKFYNAAGGQEVPPYDEELVTIASSVLEARTMPFDKALSQGLVTYLTQTQRQDYVDHVVSLGQLSKKGGARIAFSPLHGTGSTNVLPVLRQAGFDVVVNEDQVSFDGAFPTVPFQIPNPEVPSAMEAVISTAQKNDCVVAMATDPDADRIGVAIPDDQGRWICLNGNQIGVLMAHHLLRERRQKGNLSGDSYVVKTEVTTALLESMAKDYGVRVIGNLLVGFKYIGDVLDQISREGRWHDFEAKEEDFVMGMEESHGVLSSPAVRDKDAAQGALAIAELAQRCHSQGTTLYQELLDLYKEFGYFGTGLKSLVMEGARGLEDIRILQKSMRENPPQEIGGRRVIAFHDRQDESGVFGAIKSETDRSSRDVLVFELEGGARMILRPSGTEPKNKTYLEVSGEPMGRDADNAALEQQMSDVNRLIVTILAHWEQTVLARLGVDYPLYATAFADSVSLKNKLLFVEEIAPELRTRISADSPESLANWLRSELGRVASPLLLKKGLEAFGDELPADSSTRWRQVLGHLFNRFLNISSK